MRSTSRVPASCVLGLLAVAATRRRPVRGRAERAARGRPGPGLFARSPRLGRPLRRGDGGAGARRVRRASLGAVAEERGSRLRFAGRVRDWQQPPGSAHAQGPRLRAGRACDEGPRQVPARARGGAVRRAARRRPTSRASCAPTPSISASTASSTSTSTTRASSAPATITSHGRAARRRGRSAGTGGSRRTSCSSRSPRSRSSWS